MSTHSQVGYLVRDLIKNLDVNSAAVCDTDGVQVKVKFIRKYVSGTVDNTNPLFAEVTCGDITKKTSFKVEKQMLLNCLKTSEMTDLEFKYIFNGENIQIQKREGDNFFINGNKYNGGCLVSVVYPKVFIESNPKVDPIPTYIPEDSNGNKMQWRSLYTENAVCRATGRKYMNLYIESQKVKPYGWWDSNYNFLSKEAAQDRIAPGGEKKEYTIESKTYTDIKWEQYVREKNSIGWCNIIKNGEVGEGYYTCNKGEYYISVEAVTIQNPNITGEFITLAKLLPTKGQGTSVIPDNFELQIIANDNGNLIYLGCCKYDSTPKNGLIKLILKRKNRKPDTNEICPFVAQEIVIANNKYILRDILPDAIQKYDYFTTFINLNANIKGEYYGLKERGLYFFVVHIGDVPMRNNFTDGLNTLKLRL